jgi:hypothetical protein
MIELTPDEHKILVDAIQDSATVVHKGQKGMNERIKQLADEAAKYSAVMALPTGQSGNELFVAKFAELIVKECMKVSNRSLSKYELPSDKIAEHFGVEE